MMLVLCADVGDSVVLLARPHFDGRGLARFAGLLP